MASDKPKPAPTPPSEAPIPEPTAGGSYTRDPITNELKRNPPEAPVPEVQE
jgi:hypothetical protein